MVQAGPTEVDQHPCNAPTDGIERLDRRPDLDEATDESMEKVPSDSRLEQQVNDTADRVRRNQEGYIALDSSDEPGTPARIFGSSPFDC